jgi:PleD family two-component response regulator
MGVTTATYQVSNLATLLARADAALYRAKQNGRGRYEAG